MMKKSLLAIVFAAASLPLTFAQTTPATPSTPDQKSTATTKKTKKSKSNSKKTSAKQTGAPTTPPQK